MSTGLIIIYSSHEMSVMYPGVGRQLLPADDRLHQLEDHPRPVLREEAGRDAAERRGRLQQVQQHVSLGGHCCNIFYFPVFLHFTFFSNWQN